MDYLAIRDEKCKNVYYYNTKGEKGRILSKFPGASTRVFVESELDEALNWAGVEKIATEEENLWAITKQPKNDVKQPLENISSACETNVPQYVEETTASVDVVEHEVVKKEQSVVNVVETTNNMETDIQDEKTLKHVMSDFEKIIEIYKKNGIKLLEITTISQEKYYLLTDDIYYFRHLDKIDFCIDFLSCDESRLKNLILETIEKEKANGKKNVILNNYLSLEMFDKIPKTKYLAFGDLVYASNLNLIKENWVNYQEIEYVLDNDMAKKNVTFSTSCILSIKPVPTLSYRYLVREKEFATFIKKAIKQQEKEKLKELQK